MGEALDRLVRQLALEKTGPDTFVGESEDLGWGTLFGGHVLGQALSAAAATVGPERLVHSLHSYFLLPGRVDRPVTYEVDRIRDGASFATRRVIALQDGRAIFHLACSLQIEEPGLEHQDPMPEAPPPEAVADRSGWFAAAAEKVPSLRAEVEREHPFEMRWVIDQDDPITPTPGPPRRVVWVRANERPGARSLPDDPALHRSLLAYVSDHMFVTTALIPHGLTFRSPGVQIASLDHAVWFRGRFRVDEWLLYVIESPSAFGARGLVRGEFFTREGRLVASTMQEGLIRRRG